MNGDLASAPRGCVSKLLIFYRGRLDVEVASVTRGVLDLAGGVGELIGDDKPDDITDEDDLTLQYKAHEV